VVTPGSKGPWPISIIRPAAAPSPTSSANTGLDPAPERAKKATWTEFLKAHWDVLAAADFFTVDVWTGRGLTRFAVLFFIELSTRRVEIAGVTAEPDAPG
jgi:hypothetical protein